MVISMFIRVKAEPLACLLQLLSNITVRGGAYRPTVISNIIRHNSVVDHNRCSITTTSARLQIAIRNMFVMYMQLAVHREHVIPLLHNSPHKQIPKQIWAYSRFFQDTDISGNKELDANWSFHVHSAICYKWECNQTTASQSFAWCMDTFIVITVAIIIITIIICICNWPSGCWCSTLIIKNWTELNWIIIIS
jgi:hypothetical protein